MRDKRRAFRDLVDVFGFRVTVDRVDTCYRVLGVQVHNLYKPVPGRFKDYIAIPKANGYQSLHTVLFGPQGVPIEIQIRTEQMQRNAESGIAAHWMYKSGGQAPAGPPALAQDWLQNLLEMQRGAGNSVEFLEHVKVDLFPDEVYVFTPKGRILTLKRGATVVDFAYAIHSDVGNSCVAARIDRRLASLSTVLRNGQTVEIIPAPGGKPNPAWLAFVVSGKARASIRAYLKNLKQIEAEALGRRLINAELRRLRGRSGSGRPDPHRRLSGGRRSGLAAGPARRHRAGQPPPRPGRKTARRRRGGGAARPRTRPRRRPPAPTPARDPRNRGHGRELRALLPADTRRRHRRPVQPGPRDLVHRNDCRNLGSLETKRDKRLDIEWAADPDGEFSVEIRVEIGNRRGALAVVAGAIAEQGSNIENVHSREKDG